MSNQYSDPPSDEAIFEQFGVYRDELASIGASRWAFEVSRMDIRDCWGEECFLCDKAVQVSQASKEHVIPRSLGGPTIMSNMRYAHDVCNARKGSRILPDLEVNASRRKFLKDIWMTAIAGGRKYYEDNPGNGRRTPWIYRTKGRNTW